MRNLGGRQVTSGVNRTQEVCGSSRLDSLTCSSIRLTWIIDAMGSVDTTQARQAILDLLEQRDQGKTICPSDAARALGGDEGFRPLMEVVRAAAGELVREGRIEVTQRGEIVDLDRARGPIRLRAVPPRGS
jgi:hypothetical protein